MSACSRLACWSAALALALSGGAAAAPLQVVHEVYGNGSAPIPVSAYRSTGPGLHPAIFLLYGAGGLTHRGAMYDAYARALATDGNNVYVIDYHASTPRAVAAPRDRGAVFSADLGTWVTAVEQVISAVSDEPGVDASRLGLLGFSQGAYLAIAVAADDPDIGAVVEFYGGIPPSLRGHLDRLPATLILHGAADKVVPVSEAHRLDDALSASGSRHEIVIYPHAGHGFSAQLDSAAGRDALQRTLRFFKANL